jgi:hypothetical protein
VRRMVVLVNGLPAAGKSMLARPLAMALGLPLLSKDVIKETHADVLGADPPPRLTQRNWNHQLGRAASFTMWALLRDSAPGAVLEGAAEVWCEAPLPLLRERFAQRWTSSHPIHGAAPTTQSGRRWSSTLSRWDSGPCSASRRPRRSISRLSSNGATHTLGQPRSETSSDGSNTAPIGRSPRHDRRSIMRHEIPARCVHLPCECGPSRALGNKGVGGSPTMREALGPRVRGVTAASRSDVMGFVGHTFEE